MCIAQLVVGHCDSPREGDGGGGGGGGGGGVYTLQLWSICLATLRFD